MSGRTYVVILFFWALLTIVTPMLIRLSASANLYAGLDGEESEGMKLLLPRRALVEATASPAPAPTPAKGGVSGGDHLFSDELRSSYDPN